jgi:hypothetical protein
MCIKHGCKQGGTCACDKVVDSNASGDPAPSQGWQCPACRRVWAPWVRECEACNQQVAGAIYVMPTITIETWPKPGDWWVGATTWDDTVTQVLTDRASAWAALANM